MVHTLLDLPDESKLRISDESPWLANQDASQHNFSHMIIVRVIGRTGEKEWYILSRVLYVEGLIKT